MSIEDSRHHIHVLGETGTGKSTLLANLVLQDAVAGRSAVVIDPKGDLVEAILERLPAGAEERTCVLDPEDRDAAVGLNVLAGDDPDLIVDHVLAVFKRIYEPWWGPRTDDVMRAACLTLTQIPEATLAEVPLLLSHFDWRRNVRDKLTDVVGVSTFWSWYEKIPESQRVQHIAPLLNKLRAFLLRGPVRAIVGQAEPKLDIAELLDAGGMLLVRIPKGTLGEETSRLLGAFVIARVWQACMRCASLPEHRRRDTTLYVDEMHNYLALPRSFEDLLAEARGYRLSLVLAHQHLGQLPREMREALTANARTKLVFACSPDDASQLERQFKPELSAHDLSHLAGFQAACRPCVAGGQAPAFTFRTEPLGPGSPERARAIRTVSGDRYGVAREVNEDQIVQRHIDAPTRLLPRPMQGGRRDGRSVGTSLGTSEGPS
ncbi:MAG: type IV secretory system conjugative DNA transfer family protein, partial [Actinomycetota bacterium]